MEWREKTAQRVQREGTSCRGPSSRPSLPYLYRQAAGYGFRADLRFGNGMPNFNSSAFPEIRAVNPPHRTGRNLGLIGRFPLQSHPTWTLHPRCLRLSLEARRGLGDRMSENRWRHSMGREVTGGNSWDSDRLGSTDGLGSGGRFNCTESRDSVPRSHHTRHSQKGSTAMTSTPPLSPTAPTAAATTRRRSKTSWEDHP